MDKIDSEKNILNLENEDDLLNADELNEVQEGKEVFREEEERFDPNEENDNSHEENVLRETQKSKNQSNNKSRLSQSLKASLSIPSLVVTLVGAVAIVGGSLGLLPTIHSNDVTNFLSRSTELGFKLSKAPDKSYLMTLSNDEYNVSEEIVIRNQFVFFGLIPNTTYDLNVYDTSVMPNKRVYSANYLTRSHDRFNASVMNKGIENNLLYFDVLTSGSGISYITVEVLGDNSKSLYLYEGAPKEEFVVDVTDNVDVSCKVSINGEVTHFEQLVNPDGPQGDINPSSITLSQSTASIAVGDTLQLTATVLPYNATDKEVTWESSDSTLASVDENGLVTALGTGNVSITAFSTNFREINATCEITVTEPVIPVESVTLSQTTASLVVGDTLQLSATVLPENATNKEVTWETSDSMAASVNENGLVTALGTGNVSITAFSKSARWINATCEITISEQVIPAESVTLNVDSAEMNLEQSDSFTLIATILPDDCTQEVVWASTNQDAVGIQTYPADPTRATITGYTVGGSSTVSVTVGDVSASVIVNVINKIVHMTSITITDYDFNELSELTLDLSMREAPKSQTILYTYTPSMPTDYTATWTSSDESVVIIDSTRDNECVVKAVGEGTATLTVRSNSDPDVYDTITVIVISS